MSEDLVKVFAQLDDLKQIIVSENKHIIELFEQSINYEKTVLRLREENVELKKEIERRKDEQFKAEQEAIIAIDGRIKAFFEVISKTDAPIMYGGIQFYRSFDVPENVVILNPGLHDQFEKLILRNGSDYFLIDRELKKMVEKHQRGDIKT
jgi:hypothetical protein